jgi:diguanylate cyclase (GGDEF)-like protein
MTGLRHRSQFVTLLERVRTGAVLLADVDQFVFVNYVLGHREGDALLCRMARQARAIFGARPVFRFGGQEFAVYVADEANAPALAEDWRVATASDFEGERVAIRAGAGAAGVVNPAADKGLLTLSIAGTYLGRYANNANAMTRLDQAQRIAKWEGGNRVVFAGPMAN